MGRPFGCLVHYRGSKTVKDCELKYGGHLSRNVPERCMFTSSQKLFHDSSKQQDLRRFLEEVSYLHESLIRDYTILRYILMPESCTEQDILKNKRIILNLKRLFCLCYEIISELNTGIAMPVKIMNSFPW